MSDNQEFFSEILKEREQLRNENARLRAALGYYAQRGHWTLLKSSSSGWEIAEAALDLAPRFEGACEPDYNEVKAAQLDYSAENDEPAP